MEKCAECENAPAALRCVDEDLLFCRDCSARLHSKRARQHHELEAVRAAGAAALVCDECEDAPAEVECFECGGRLTAMVFCGPCSAGLHSRAARVRHQVSALGRLRKQGREKCISGRMVVDLTDDVSDSEAEAEAEAENVHQRETGAPGVKEERTRKIIGAISSDKSCIAGRETFWPRAEAEKLSDVSLAEKRNAESESADGRKCGAPKSSAKREPHSRTQSNSSDSELSDIEQEHDGVHRIRKGSISLEAFVVAADDEDDDDAPKSFSDGDVQTGVKKRIKNMLELGLHPDTPEFEAQQALKNAQRLLTKHNLQQAEVLKGNLRDTSSLVGGMRVVELRTKGRTMRERIGLWVKRLCSVIRDNFDCQYYYQSATNSKPYTVVFYGISHNAHYAGYAFAATFNKITKMSAAYAGGEAFDDKENGNAKSHHIRRGTYTRVARVNYREGIVAGLWDAVKSAHEMRQQSGSHEDKQSGGETCNRDGEDNIPLYGKPVATNAAEMSMAIQALVVHSQKVGEDFLKQKGIKVRRETIKKRSTRNEDAFSRGKKDAASIDINQRAIAGAKVKKPKSRCPQ